MTTCPKCQYQFKTANSVAGGKARWRNTTKPERSAALRTVARARWAKVKGAK